jgi:hypothetical protein
VPISISTAHLSDISEVRMLYGLKVQAFGCGKINADLLPKTIQTTTLNVLKNNECERFIESITHKFEHVPINLMCTNTSPYVKIQGVRIGFFI